jgi:hypothetical protein
MKKVIGTITTYHGQEHRYLAGHKVRIVAVLKNAARPDIDVDGPATPTWTRTGTSSGPAASPPTTASRCSPSSRRRDASAS